MLGRVGRLGHGVHDRRHASGERARLRARAATRRGSAAAGARRARSARATGPARQAPAGRGRQPRPGHEAIHEQADAVRTPRDLRLPAGVLYRCQCQEAAGAGRLSEQLRVRQRAGLVHPHPARSHRVQIRGFESDREG